jgi:hypothetical protein
MRLIRQRNRDVEFSDDGARLEVLLTEYDSLRQESLGAIGNRITIANFTFGAIAIMLAALLSLNKPNLAIGITALAFIPQVSKTGLMIWLGEYNRSQRAGRQLRSIENRVNELLGTTAMTWENSLAGTSVHMGYPYLSTVLLLLGAGWSSSVFGIVVIVQQLRPVVPGGMTWWVFAGVAGYALVVELLFAWFFRRKWKNIRRNNASDRLL